MLSLLENAVYHGMEFMDGDGEIEVNAYAKENSLYIDVTDNGMGIPEEEIDGLLKRDSKNRGKGSGGAPGEAYGLRDHFLLCRHQ